jgi:hypothetical protein
VHAIERAGHQLPARGNGSNTIYVDPENDIVFVWHWHQGGTDAVVPRILASITER